MIRTDSSLRSSASSVASTLFTRKANKEGVDMKNIIRSLSVVVALLLVMTLSFSVLAEELGLIHISTGDIFRENIKKYTQK